ncbi:MAG TPA: exodeoxyribonuclease V subunit alpha [Rudaea sp.]|nr:exodeoxyribonuclease V subunit alpha [Rudaea sp.]
MNARVDELRDIDQALGRWVATRSGSDLLGRAATQVNHGEGQGHVRCALDADAGFTREEIDALRAHDWVGKGDAFKPFVLDADAHLYTWRNWRNETRLAQMLRERAAGRACPLDAQTLAADVAELFAGSDAAATHWQRIAVAAAPGARVFVLAGGPGTGKTTTVLRMLAMLLRHASACGLPTQPSIALAAPTGKAAQRLSESVASSRAALAAGLAADSEFAPILARLVQVQAQTLHRLLAYQPWSESFAFGPESALPADVVVVDEASMIDLAMLRRLLEALRPQAMLILLGDPAQLYAIEAGSVLGDMVGSVSENAMPKGLAQQLQKIAKVEASADTSPLAGQIVTLTHTWRANARLRDALDALRRGDETWLDGVLTGANADELRWHACKDAANVRERVRAWVDARAQWFDNLMQGDIAPVDALRHLRNAQILCALRAGTFGAAKVNALVERLLAARFGFAVNGDWHHGRPVIVIRNDYARGLYNGDVGVALDRGDGLRVWFDGPDGVARSFSPRALPAHETAWAITIHRSQGSEYDHVAVLLPPDAQHRILSRELVYTAVSRARKHVQLWASADSLRAAVAQPVMRRSGLREQLNTV